MCGRFNVSDSPALQSLLDELGIDIGPVEPRYNIAPTEAVITLYQQDEQAAMREMRWWLTPRWAKAPSQKYSMFNARAETVASSRAFAQPFKTQRAIVPASSFVEWQRSADQKQPYLIAPENNLLLFAAIWEHWQGDDQEIFSCAVLTCDAVPSFAHVHHRQPLMLPLEAVGVWLDPARAGEDVQHYLQPSLPAPLCVEAVDTSINNARNKVAPVPVGEKEWLAE
ncbi:MAG: SOS response-associated peptidase [Gammaproteobacteria bacterium]|nr:SOS response-associated peptidase [Gammaproteobacteria bacterium]NND39538.1 SOS response-associated peptidase [Pseudomonadales bacterium]NNM11847.1 SOS response-associated peptidase [Pseudomonadales bacterium]